MAQERIFAQRQDQSQELGAQESEALDKAIEGASVAAQQSDASEVDSILDEIDDVLSSGAAEFVDSYIQQGGE
ncbi:ubiquitin-like protein Pup [Boudabousia liubingyangii]|uniref:Prokaryotic ubiquitin-like protein Pup n=1 Tax=Boudabousia liubingyangii TaxID=1921764 RepID=A0A1Q5PNB6_9ACTO|nr:ubiquitin-like protein Pup [Boudabousia liubingyangii]OKL47619.1 ubiquitin-like protein Pup [Boudabousia liubingyangii]OKL49044.1 ubiquitin-like protein Pup [Boudabousia liubingyangii]